ncbi:MAG: hypothetical protein ACOX22_07310 [Caldicoprobacterales bacterium]|jgi:hypothetical protein
MNPSRLQFGFSTDTAYGRIISELFAVTDDLIYYEGQEEQKGGEF